METPIFIHFGETVIPGVLNDTKAARELIKRLPCTIRASRYEFDICGVIDPPLPRIPKELVTGWHNGDISFDGTYFTILFGQEEKSASYGMYSNLGRISCPLSQMEALHGDYDILIEKAEQTEK